MRSRFGCAFFIYIVLIYSRVAVLVARFYLEISAPVVACRYPTRFRSPCLYPQSNGLSLCWRWNFIEWQARAFHSNTTQSRVDSFFPLGTSGKGKERHRLGE